MKVYEDFKGNYILIRKSKWTSGTEFMIIEEDDMIKLIKIEESKRSLK
jgi:hypothetical protein